MSKKKSGCGFLVLVIIGIIVLVSIMTSKEKPPSPTTPKPVANSVVGDDRAVPVIEFETAGYYKSDDKHRIFAKYPSQSLDSGSISQDVWDRIIEVGLNEMYTKGRTTRVFFYWDEVSALKARLNQHSSHEAALKGAYYAKPFASVEMMFDGRKWLTKYPETTNEDVVELH